MIGYTYRAIDLFVDGDYKETTIYAKNLEDARERYADITDYDLERITARWSEQNAKSAY